MTEIAPHDADWLEQRLAEKLAEIRNQRAEQVPRRAQAWLALAPVWPLELARKGFPCERGKIGTGTSVDRFLDQVSEALDVERLAVRSPWEEPCLRLGPGTRESVLEELAERTDFDLRRELTLAARTIIEAGGGRLRFDPPLDRWARLAVHADDESELGTILERQVDEALEAARQAFSLAAPEALRWIETAVPLAELFGGRVEVALSRAQLRHELFYRRAHDERRLANYFRRPELDRVFSELVDDEQRWAVHFIGDGGVGKTMFLRHVVSRLAREHSVKVARVDFDYLNPDYPFRAPGLLLTGLAEELRLQADDPAAELRFHSFSLQVDALHERIASAYHRGRPAAAEPLAAIDGDDFQEVLKLFSYAVDALGQPSVLILDTCEELAKVRVDGTVPESVRATFEILERVHRLCRQVRVVFSGRRELPQQEYLQVHRIEGFTEDEARHLLAAYHANGGSVPGHLVPTILGLTVTDDASRDGEVRHNPYDLDIFAAWVCAEPDLDASRLTAAGVHHYVKERILGRLAPGIRPMFPALTLLGRFDRELLEELFAGTPHLAENLKDLGRQEVLTPDYGGQLELWVLDPILRQRLRRYYEQEERAPYLRAHQRVAEVLGTTTLERPFSLLTPQYFAAGLEAKTDRPREAARWWHAVEARVLAEEQWTWADEMISVLLEMPMLDPGRGTSLRAAVEATHAAARLHTAGAEPRQEWAEVAELAARHPDPKLRRVLELRARYALATLRGTIAEPDGHDDQSLDERDRLQLAASFVAMLESYVEEAERRGQTAEPEVALAAARALAQRAGSTELRVFARSLEGRLIALGDRERGSAILRELLEKLEKTTARPVFLDWLPPDDLRLRLDLEYLRAALRPWEEADELVTLAELTAQDSLDADRLASVLLGLHRTAPEPLARELEPRFPAARTFTARPRCNAHRLYRPYAVVLQEARAWQGDVEDALDELRDLSREAEEARRPDLVLEVDRVRARIFRRYRLLSENWHFPSTLEGSDDPADRLLRDVTEGSLHGFRRRQPLLRPDRPSLETSLAYADWAFETAELELLENGPTHQYREGLRQAASVYAQRGESVSHLLVSIALALDAARQAALGGDAVLRSQLRAALAAVGEVYGKQPHGDLPDSEKLDEALVEDELAPWLDDLDPIWRPWLVRLAACLVVAREKEPGPLARELTGWLDLNYVTIFRPETGPERILPIELAFLKEWTKPSGGDEPTTRTKAEATRGINLDLDMPELAPSVGKAVLAEAAREPLRSSGRFVVLKGVAWALLGLAIVAGAVYGSYLLFERGVEWLIGGDLRWELGLPSFIAFVMLLIKLPGMGQALVARWIWRLDLRCRVDLSGTRDLNEPVATSDTIRLRLGPRRLSVLRGLFPFSEKNATLVDFRPTKERRYAFLADAMQETENRKGRGRWSHSFFRVFGLFFDLRLEVDGDSAAAPWEGVVGLPLARYPYSFWAFSRCRVRIRRVTRERQERPQMAVEAPAEVVTVNLGVSKVARARSDWSRSLRGRKRTKLDRRFRFDHVDRASALERPRPKAVVLHLFGTAFESSSGLRFQLDAGGTTGARIDEIVRTYPNLRLCILQASATYADSRDDGDRRDAALMRRLGAELFAAGVPAVLLVPPVDAAATDYLLERLAELLAMKPRNATRELVAVTRALQEKLFSTWANEDKVENLEPVFDVCLYAADEVNL